MKIIFIRHGKTHGNLEKRYVGRTDEPLCSIGRNELIVHEYPDCGLVIVSRMKRCVQTAQMLYPNRKIVIYDGLEECDFGDFEGKNYLGLSGNPDYQKWIDSGGKSAFPNGENPDDFRKRCVMAFESAVSEYSEYDAIAFVVHGGTIMSILERYAVPKKDYYDYQIQNGHGYTTEYDGEKITIMEYI